MQKVEYKFADGTESAVEVSDELHAVIEALEKEEKSSNRRETRRHVSLEELAEQCIEPPVEDVHDFGDMFGNIRNETLYAALQKLGAKKRELLYKVFFEGMTSKEIAEEEKVSYTTITWRLRRALLLLRLNW